MTASRSIVAVVVVAVVTACNGSPPPILTPLGTSSSDSVTQLIAITTAMATMDGASGLAASNNLVVDSAATFYDCAGAYEVPEGTSGNTSCGSTGCAFDVRYLGEVTEPYEPAQPYAYAFGGTAMLEGNQIALKLQQGNGSAEPNDVWTIEGTLAMTTSEITGTLHVAGNTTDWQTCGPGSTAITVDYQSVALGPNGCVMGGAVYAVMTTTPAGGESEAFEGSIAFGPACGELR